MRYKCTVCYDGSQFHGFQTQDNLRTVQVEIENALQVIHKKKINHWRSVEYVLLDDLSLAALNEIGYDDKEEFIKYNKDFFNFMQ